MVTILLFLIFFTSEVSHTPSFISKLLTILGARQNLILSGALECFNFAFSAEDCLSNTEELCAVDVVAFSFEHWVVLDIHVKNEISKSTIQSLVTLVSDSQQHAIGNALGDLYGEFDLGVVEAKSLALFANDRIQTCATTSFAYVIDISPAVPVATTSGTRLLILSGHYLISSTPFA